MRGFVQPGELLVQLPAQAVPGDRWSKANDQALEILRSATDAEGRKLEIVFLADPVDIRSRKRDFVASYVNSYVCDGAVIRAEFGDRAADKHARELLQGLYPGREIVSLNVDALGETGGGIHCATQQQPKAGL